jgi:ABC-type uncharacterized transport system ATPase subunit
MYQSILKFWFVFKLTWMERLAYRVNFFMEIASGILSSLILEVEPHRAASIASQLLANFSVKDISIIDPPLEKIIESIYQGRTSG